MKPGRFPVIHKQKLSKEAECGWRRRGLNDLVTYCVVQMLDCKLDNHNTDRSIMFLLKRGLCDT